MKNDSLSDLEFIILELKKIILIKKKVLKLNEKLEESKRIDD